jgi:uncharacterized protein (UPF0147 family)
MPIGRLSAIDDAQSFHLKLRLASDPTTGAYEVSIELAEVDVLVEVVDVDLRRAVRRAADRCAERLRESGFAVTTTEVIGALEEALQDSEIVKRAAQAPN